MLSAKFRSGSWCIILNKVAIQKEKDRFAFSDSVFSAAISITQKFWAKEIQTSTLLVGKCRIYGDKQPPA